VAGQFEGTAEIDRPIGEVFAYLAEGTNDPDFSPRVRKIQKVTEGPVGVGTVFVSTVKDAGLTTRREFRITEYTEPTRLRWAEQTKNLVTAREGGYDLTDLGDGRTRLRVFNVLAGNGLGKLVTGLALRAARKDAPAFAQRIKRAVENVRG
jgi:hypothetical protein